MITNTSQGYVPPSYEKLCTIILIEEKERIDARLQDIKKRSTTRVSIVSDGWTDIANKPLVSILIVDIEKKFEITNNIQNVK